MGPTVTLLLLSTTVHGLGRPSPVKGRALNRAQLINVMGLGLKSRTINKWDEVRLSSRKPEPVRLKYILPVIKYAFVQKKKKLKIRTSNRKV